MKRRAPALPVCIALAAVALVGLLHLGRERRLFVRACTVLAAAALVGRLLAVRVALAGPDQDVAAQAAHHEPTPYVRTAELWYATQPAPGIWAELKLIVDNPLPEGQEGASLVVPHAFLEDFAIRSTEPELVGPPASLPDGRYALRFPPPLGYTWNWYRVHLTVQTARPHRMQVALDLSQGRTLRVQPRVLYTDRDLDPFVVVPEPVVSWVPGHARSVFPFVLAYAVLAGAVVAGGCGVAFWMVRGPQAGEPRPSS